jgi:hypothetical protein
MAQNTAVDEAIRAVGDFCLEAMRNDAEFTIDDFVSDAIGKHIVDGPREGTDEDENTDNGVQLTELQQLSIEALERSFSTYADGEITDDVRLRALKRFQKLFEGYKSGMKDTTYGVEYRDVDRRLEGAKKMARLLSFIGVTKVNEIREAELSIQNGVQKPTGSSLIEIAQALEGATKVDDGRPVIELSYVNEFNEVDFEQGVKLMPLLVVNSREVYQQDIREGRDKYMDRDKKVYRVLVQMERSEEGMTKLTSRVESNDWWLDENERPTVADMFQLLYRDGMYILVLLLDMQSNRIIVESNVMEALLQDAMHLMTSSVEHNMGEDQLRRKEYIDQMYAMTSALTQCCAISSELSGQRLGRIAQEIDEGTAKDYLIAIIKQVSNRNDFISDVRDLKSLYEDAKVLPRLFENNDPLLIHILLLLNTPENELNSVREHHNSDGVEIMEADLIYSEDDAMQEHVRPRKLKGTKMLVNSLREVYKRNSNWTATIENYGVNTDGVMIIEKEVDLSNALMGANIKYGTWATISKYRLNACLERVWGNILDGTASSKELPLGNREVYRNLDLYDFGFPITCHRFNEIESTELKDASFRQRYIAIAQDQEIKRKDQNVKEVDDDEDTDVDDGN